MKKYKIIKINNKYQNKGITLSDNMTFGDVVQGWSYLTRFIIDTIEGKELGEHALENQSKKLRMRHKKFFDALLCEWLYYELHGGIDNE